MRTNAYQSERDITHALNMACQGQWDMVLPRVIPEICEAIAAGDRRHVDCFLPDHGVGSVVRKFRITKQFALTGAVICTCTEDHPIGNAIELVMRARCMTFIEARNLIIDVIGMVRTTDIPAPIVRAARVPTAEEADKLRREIEATQRSIIRCWEQTVPLTDPTAHPALKWFERRGLLPVKLPINDVRFHKAMLYKDGTVDLGHHPAILCMYRDEQGNCRTFHRTFLNQDGGKADVPEVRKNFSIPSGSSVSGTAVRLDKPTDVLMLAEGLESSLSARLLTGMPTWACMSATLLRQVEIPESVRIVTIWADKDSSDAGQKAAKELVERLISEGRKAVALLPPGDIPEGQKGVDWNDLLMKEGAQAVRQMPLYEQWHGRLQQMLHPDATPEQIRVINLAERAFVR